MIKRIDVDKCASKLAHAFNQEMQPGKLANKEELIELLAFTNALIIRQIPTIQQDEVSEILVKAANMSMALIVATPTVGEKVH